MTTLQIHNKQKPLLTEIEIQEIDARRDRLMAEEREEVRQRRIDLTAARLFATGSTAAEAYAAADVLEEAREAFIAGRKAST